MTRMALLDEGLMYSCYGSIMDDNKRKVCGAVMIIELILGNFAGRHTPSFHCEWKLLKGHLLWKICFVLELWQLKEISKTMKMCFTGR